MQSNKGFTLIELMITVAIIGVLAAIAYPSYQDQVRKSRRAEAQAFLMNLGSRQQQMLLDARSFAASTASFPNFTVPAQVSGFYTIGISAPASTPPSFTATATPSGDQAHDKCGTLQLDQTGAKSASKAGVAQPGCW